MLNVMLALYLSGFSDRKWNNELCINRSNFFLVFLFFFSLSTQTVLVEGKWLREEKKNQTSDTTGLCTVIWIGWVKKFNLMKSLWSAIMARPFQSNILIHNRFSFQISDHKRFSNEIVSIAFHHKSVDFLVRANFHSNHIILLFVEKWILRCT